MRESATFFLSSFYFGIYMEYIRRKKKKKKKKEKNYKSDRKM